MCNENILESKILFINIHAFICFRFHRTLRALTSSLGFGTRGVCLQERMLSLRPTPNLEGPTTGLRILILGQVTSSSLAKVPYEALILQETGKTLHPRGILNASGDISVLSVL